jgi:hypothetical protein
MTCSSNLNGNQVYLSSSRVPARPLGVGVAARAEPHRIEVDASPSELTLAGFGREPSEITRLEKETLAEMIGTTRSRVSFFMNKFRKLGFIEYNGKLEVQNSLLNLVLHDKPEIKTRDEAISAA